MWSKVEQKNESTEEEEVGETKMGREADDKRSVKIFLMARRKD